MRVRQFTSCDTGKTEIGRGKPSGEGVSYRRHVALMPCIVAALTLSGASAAAQTSPTTQSEGNVTAGALVGGTLGLGLGLSWMALLPRIGAPFYNLNEGVLKLGLPALAFTGAGAWLGASLAEDEPDRARYVAVGAAVGGAAGGLVGGLIGKRSGHGVPDGMIGMGAGILTGALVGVLLSPDDDTDDFLTPDLHRIPIAFSVPVP